MSTLMSPHIEKKRKGNSLPVLCYYFPQVGSFDFNATFPTCCYRIIMNTCYDIMRKQKRRGRYNKGSVDPDFYESKLFVHKHYFYLPNRTSNTPPLSGGNKAV